MKTKTIIRDEKGFASVVVALILIVVLSLITVGFAQLARREQQSSLDNQLSNQAFYAAETGVNDVYKLIKSGTINSGSPGVNSGTCLNPTTFGISSTIDRSGDVTYPCVIVNLNPPRLHFSLAAGDNKTTTFTPSGVSGSSIDLSLSWGSSDGHTRYTHRYSTDRFPSSTTWNTAPFGPAPPVVELTVDPIGPSTDRASLQAAAFTVYLYPSNVPYNSRVDRCAPGFAPSYSCVQYPSSGPDDTSQAPIVEGKCNNANTPDPCEVVISNIPYSAGTSYMVHLTDLYDSGNIDLIGGVPGGGVGTYNFNNAQDVIDVTGKAQNVLKRIQVYLSPPELNQNPGFAIQTGNLCKHFQSDPSTSTFYDAYGNNITGSSADACNLEN